MSIAVANARSFAEDMQHGLLCPAFYDLMETIVEQDIWRSYREPVHNELLEFDHFPDFLHHRKGLDIKNTGLFSRCLKAVAGSAEPIAERAKGFLFKLEQRSLELTQTPPVDEIQKLEERKLLDRAGPGRGHQKRGDNITSFSGNKGTSQAYLLRRMARDCPEKVEQIGAGKPYASVRQAAIAAGIVKDVPTIRMTDPAKAAAAIVRKLGLDWAAQLAAALTELLTQEASHEA